MTISVDKNKCIKCHKCVEACQGLVLNVSPLGFPNMKKQNEPFCIKCGKCEITCPNEAITINDAGVYPTEDYTDINKVHFAEFAKHMIFRRSIRNFKEIMVDKKTIENMLDIVRYAPSSSNTQPVRWVLIYEPQKMEIVKKLITSHKLTEFSKIKDNSPQSRSVKRFIAAATQKKDVLCWNAPHILLAVVPKSHPNAITDSIIAMEWVDILAPAYGIATCWTDLFSLAINEYPDIKKALGIKSFEICRCSMALGYPDIKITKIPPRKPTRITFI